MVTLCKIYGKSPEELGLAQTRMDDDNLKLEVSPFSKISLGNFKEIDEILASKEEELTSEEKYIWLICWALKEYEIHSSMFSEAGIVSEYDFIKIFIDRIHTTCVYTLRVSSEYKTCFIDLPGVIKSFELDKDVTSDVFAALDSVSELYRGHMCGFDAPIGGLTCYLPEEFEESLKKVFLKYGICKSFILRAPGFTSQGSWWSSNH